MLEQLISIVEKEDERYLYFRVFFSMVTDLEFILYKDGNSRLRSNVELLRVSGNETVRELVKACRAYHIPQKVN